MRILTCNLFGVLFRLLLPKWVKWGLHEIKIEREPKKSTVIASLMLLLFG